MRSPVAPNPRLCYGINTVAVPVSLGNFVAQGVPASPAAFLPRPSTHPSGILLTSPRILTKVITAMRAKPILRAAACAPKSWQLLVCLLLSLLFLYNPFFCTTNFAASVLVSHLPSYRATVASSELLTADKSEDSDFAPAVIATLPQALFQLKPPAAPSEPFTVSEQLLPAQVFFTSFWFRPPPSA
jgi:hypothetical protein